MRTGAEIIWECLMREGVEVVFGYPGAAVLPLYDALATVPIRHVLCRHEQGAAHMADGYARASGRVGVAVATSGPGATNLTTGIATAMRDSVPTVFLTGQVFSGQLGTQAFQEVDMTALTRPITKSSLRVTDARSLAPTLQAAFATARSGRPGPVLVDVCRDAQEARAPFGADEEGRTGGAPSYPAPDALLLERAGTLLAQAKRPVILAGHGVVISGAAAELRRFAERLDIPVAMTLLGLGAFPARHGLALGLMGMHGQSAANHAIQEADLLIALGMRFSDRVTGKLSRYAPDARKIHIDIDPGEIGRLVRVDVGLVGEVGPALEALMSRVPARRHDTWRTRIQTWRAEAGRRDILRQAGEDKLHGAHVIDALTRATRGRAIVTTDVGQHQMWVAQYYGFERPRQMITSGGLGTMGFGLPAAMGAKVACPEAEVWLVAGDGGFQMTQAELGTLAQEGIDLKIAIVNNGFLGMVRQWQELFYERRYMSTPMRSPDFAQLAAAHGIPAERVERRETIDGAIERARRRPGPALVEFRVNAEGKVYPMVPAGAALHEMIRRPLSGDVREELSA